MITFDVTCPIHWCRCHIGLPMYAFFAPIKDLNCGRYEYYDVPRKKFECPGCVKEAQEFAASDRRKEQS